MTWDSWGGCPREKSSWSFRLVSSTFPPPFDAVFVDSKRLNGRFRSRPSYDHPAVSGSPLVELHPREFVVALFHELRPLMRGLGSRAPLRRQTISSRVRIRRMYNHRSLPRTSSLPSFKYRRLSFPTLTSMHASSEYLYIWFVTLESFRYPRINVVDLSKQRYLPTKYQSPVNRDTLKYSDQILW